MTETTLLIARHGNTFGPGEIVRRIGRRTDLPLAPSGIEQAHALGRFLGAQKQVPDVILTSTLRRTIETAEHIQSELGLTLVAQPIHTLDEIDYGPDENQPEEQVVARIGRAALQAWEEQSVAPPGWNVDVKALVNGWIQLGHELVERHAGRRILVISSAGVIRFALAMLGERSTTAPSLSLKVSTGSVGRFSHQGTAWKCHSWNLRPASEEPL